MNPNGPTPFNNPNDPGSDSFGRSTQPLPPHGQNTSNPPPGTLLNGLQSGAPTGNSATAPPAAPPSAPAYGAPSYSAPSVQAPAPGPAPAPTSPLASVLKVPLPTMIGLAVTGGVLLAILVPAAMRRAIPPASMKTLPPSVDTPIVVRPPAQDNGGSTAQATSGPLDAGAKAPVLAPKDSAADAQNSASSQSTSTSQASPDDTLASDASTRGTGSGTKNVDDGSDAASQPSQADAQPNDSTQPSAQSDAQGAALGRTQGKAPHKSRHRGRALYSIAPPEGWRRGQSAGRATWRGPNGAQLLVEVAPDVTSSPRADWEKLSRAFEKKYGPRYRSLGIHETTLAGRPASQWEFELDSPSGATTHKIDIAVHAGGRGYAVLGSAPSDKFDQMRPQLDAAINSFQLHSLSSDQDSAPTHNNGGSSDESGAAASADSEKGF